MARDVVFLTIHNRDDMTLAAVFRGLSKNNLEDAEIVCIDDGSTEDYEGLVELFRDDVGLPIKWERAPDYEAYRIGTHNNPARVNNAAVAHFSGCERLFFLSSDTILPPDALDRARAVVDRGSIYVPRTLDMDTGTVFCGKERMFPMMWFVGCKREWCEAIGWFDDKYSDGMAFEDCDFMGRLFLHVKKLIVDLAVTAFHQSHDALYVQDGLVGYNSSKTYTLEKWGGRIPWAGEAEGAFTYKRADVGNSIIVTPDKVWASP